VILNRHKIKDILLIDIVSKIYIFARTSGKQDIKFTINEIDRSSLLLKYGQLVDSNLLLDI